ncbi:hypothetical protein HOY80DRAFT_1036814 [Tuber brumale]|nr:hypothetical protein HOY80DRAFT_1036814 [Tuber brumale]
MTISDFQNEHLRSRHPSSSIKNKNGKFNQSSITGNDIKMDSSGLVGRDTQQSWWTDNMPGDEFPAVFSGFIPMCYSPTKHVFESYQNVPAVDKVIKIEAVQRPSGGEAPEEGSEKGIRDSKVQFMKTPAKEQAEHTGTPGPSELGGYHPDISNSREGSGDMDSAAGSTGSESLRPGVTGQPTPMLNTVVKAKLSMKVPSSDRFTREEDDLKPDAFDS